DLHVRVFLSRLDRSLHDRARREIAPHRIDGDTHGLALLSFFDHDGFAALRVEPAAVGADEVGADGFAAAGTVGVLARLQVQMTSAFALTRLGGASLRYGHDFNSFFDGTLFGSWFSVRRASRE